MINLVSLFDNCAEFDKYGVEFVKCVKFGANLYNSVKLFSTWVKFTKFNTCNVKLSQLW